MKNVETNGRSHQILGTRRDTCVDRDGTHVLHVTEGLEIFAEDDGRLHAGCFIGRGGGRWVLREQVADGSREHPRS